MNDKLTTYELLGGLSVTGIIVGLGQLLASKEELTTRIILGRALSSLGLSLVAGVVLLQFPEAHPLVLIGTGAALASLGTSFLERYLQRKLGLV